MPNFIVLDERDVWHQAACDAARRAGYGAKRVFSGDDFGQAKSGDVAFTRPHADWRKLPANRIDYKRMVDAGHTMIQDQAQIDVYENKSAQYMRWWHWMPPTWRFTDGEEALEFLKTAELPIVSKADVGASSVNVRVLFGRHEAEQHIRDLFGHGVMVNHGAHCPMTRQKGYALLQKFIPHKTTYRVNAIGNARAVFFRYCYPNRPVAQTGNVDPAFEMTDEVASLLEYSDVVFNDIGSKWCALDILRDKDGWKLLETSLAWPWPSPGRCNEGTIFRSQKGRRWIDMFDVMFDELDAGAWSNGH